MAKLKEVDRLQCLYLSSEFACCQERLKNLDQQQQHIRTTEVLLLERRAQQTKLAAEYEAKMDEQSEMLKEQYGIERQDQIDWETGEIKETTPESADDRVPGPYDRTPGGSSGSVPPGLFGI